MTVVNIINWFGNDHLICKGGHFYMTVRLQLRCHHLYNLRGLC